MSESVNMKVVIFWVLIIFVFVGLGLFGYLNQDLVQNKEDEPFVPQVNTEKLVSCKTTVERGDIQYDFSLNQDDSIKDVRIVYIAKDGTIDDYASATSLSKINVLGVNPSLQYEYNNFMLTLLLTINKFDANNIVSYKQYLDDLKIVIINEQNLDNYKNNLNTTYGSVSCENATNTQPAASN